MNRYWYFWKSLKIGDLCQITQAEVKHVYEYNNVKMDGIFQIGDKKIIWLAMKDTEQYWLIKGFCHFNNFFS